jgi:DNA-binding NarL/FixJ family response regulator
MIIRNSNAQGLIREIREFAPDIIILETRFDYLRRIRKRSGGAKIIMLTAHNIPEYIEAGRSYGADHVFCKDRVGLSEIQRLVDIIAREVPGADAGRGNIRKKDKGNGV